MAGGPVSVRSGARRGVYALVAAGLALLCVELPLRALLPDPRALAQEDGRRVLVFGYDPRAPVTERDAAGQVRFARNPPNLRRQSWSARKPEGTYRIVVVGDSTVFARLTEALSAGLRVPGRTVEVLNYGMPGAGSDRVRILWQDAVRQDPDLLLLYVGHNDWTEAAINSLSIQPFPVRAVRSAVRYSGWGRLLGRLTGRSAPPLAVALGQPVQHVVAGMLREERDAVTLPAWPEVARRFRGNLDAMCRAASGRSFAFVEQASNLLAPGKLAKEADPDGRVKEQLIRGFKALYEGNLSKADEDGWAVVSAHPDVGPGWVLLGRVAAARGNQPGALEHLRRGRELDRAGVRADSRHRAVLGAAARACGAPYVPTEDALYAQPDALSIQRPLFADSVHPSGRGYTLLARVLVEGLQAQGLLPPATTFDASVMLPERTDPLARGWNNVPDVANPMSPGYDPNRPLPLPPLPGDGPPDGAGGASKGAGP